MKRIRQLLKSVILMSLMLVLTCELTACSFFAASTSSNKITETHDAADYFDETYLEYNGGKGAAVFFREFADTTQYKDIAFHYKDGEKGNYLNKHYEHTVFALDVYYDRTVFLELSDTILQELIGKSAEETFALYYENIRTAPYGAYSFGSFFGYKVEKEDSIYRQNSAAVMFDPLHNTIRYLFLVNANGDTYDIISAAEYVLQLSGNTYSNRFIFDYSDILSEEYATRYVTLHISPAVCGYFFEDVSPQTFCETNGEGTWLEGKVWGSIVDADGCLVLYLRRSTIREWKNTFIDLQILQCVLGDSRDLGIHVDDSQDSLDLMKDAHTCGFEISEDYKQFIESPEDNGWYFPFVMSGCIKMQVFNGVPCSEIRVEYLEIDAEGKILDKVVFPDDVEDNADLSD